MRKLRIYKLADSQKQEQEDSTYWASQSVANKTEAVYSLWRDYCWMHKEDVDAQRLRRVLKITKLS